MCKKELSQEAKDFLTDKELFQNFDLYQDSGEYSHFILFPKGKEKEFCIELTKTEFKKYEFKKEPKSFADFYTLIYVKEDKTFKVSDQELISEETKSQIRTKLAKLIK